MEIARSEPQTAYAAFVKIFQHDLTYHLCVIPIFETLLDQLDLAMDNKLIPAFTDGHVCSPDEKIELSLTVKKCLSNMPTQGQHTNHKDSNIRVQFR